MILTIPDDEFANIVKNANTFADVVRGCGYKPSLDLMLKKRFKYLKRENGKYLPQSDADFKNIVPDEQFANAVQNANNFKDVLRGCGYNYSRINLSTKNRIVARIEQLKRSTQHFQHQKDLPKSDTEFTNIVKNAKSFDDVRDAMGGSGSMTNKIKERILKLKLSTDHFKLRKQQPYAKKNVTIPLHMKKSDEKFTQIVENATNWKSLTTLLGYKNEANGALRKKILARMEKLKLSTDKFVTIFANGRVPIHLQKTDQEFKQILENVTSMLALYQVLGYRGTSQPTVIARIKRLGLSTSHFRRKL